MEENNLSIQPTTPAVEPQKNNSFLVVLLSILLLLACLIAGFFAYQTQNLVKELTKLQSTPTPTMTITQDPTISWEVYRNEKYGFELKLPPNLVATEVPMTRFGDKISVFSTPNNPELCQGDCNIIDSAKTKTINGITTRYLTGWWGEVGGNIAQSYASYVIPSKEKYLIIQIQELPFSFTYEANRKVQPVDNIELSQFDQIVSTFRFIEPSSPVACTMEAKICPDGSAVGRSGPKCEFAACPTLKPTTSPLP